MKKVMVVLILLLMASPALAIIKPMFSDIEKISPNEYGAGVDLVVFQDKSENAILYEVDIEYKYDWEIGGHEAYLVGKINLWDKIKRIFEKKEE